MGIVGLSLAATRGRAAAACHSTCAEQLAECKRTCPGDGQGRRACRAACAERSTCTAPGARIRTLAYVVSECTTDPQGRSSLKQKLVVRRGNCDPLTVVETAASPPVPDPLGLCRFWGESRNGATSMLAGVFQHMGVLPDGSGVVFEVTPQFSLPIGTAELPQGEGIFFVRADGSGLRRLGAASRVRALLAPNDAIPLRGVSLGGAIVYLDTGRVFSVSPNGRSIALIDLGPDTAGHEAPQIFLLDLRSGQRTQLTHQSRIERPSYLDPGISFAEFIDSRTIGYFSGYPALGNFRGYRVMTDGNGVPEEIPAPVLIPGARIVAQFTITGTHLQLLLVNFPDKRPVNPPASFPVSELFLIDGKNLLQLTNFGRSDTGFGSSFIARGRVFFQASANPLGENPAEICQVFSINKFGSDLRQLTRLPSDGRPGNGCYSLLGPVACGIDLFSLVPDQVTRTVLFGSGCDPLGDNPYGNQLFAMRPDGSGLRQVTATRGMTTGPDGTVHVEIPGPFAYSLGRHPATLP